MILPSHPLFFPLDIVAKASDDLPGTTRCSREERDVLAPIFEEYQGDRCQADRGASSPADCKRPDDRDDATLPDPTPATDDEIRPVRHPEHLALIPAGAVA